MKAFGKVLKFELTNYFQNKSYIVTTLIVTVLLAAAMCIPTIVSAFKNDSSKQETVTPEDTPQISEAQTEYVVNYAIYDPNGFIDDYADFSQAFAAGWINASSETELEEMVNDGTVEGGFAVYSETEAKYFVKKSSMFSNTTEVFESVFLAKYRQKAFAAMGLDINEIEPYYNMGMNIETVAFESNGFTNFVYAYALIFLLYFMILMYGNMIATSVTTEKSSRTIEVLVTSTSTNSLLCGKVIAGTIASVFQTALIMGATLISYRLNKPAWDGIISFNLDVPVNVLIVFIIFGILGYLFYAFIFGMLGALVSKTEDISTSTGPVMMVFMVVFIVTMYSLTVADSIWMKVMTFLPFSSCNAVVARMAVGNLKLWEVVVSLVILVVSDIIVAFGAAKIYRMTTLMYGNPIKLGNAFKMLKKDKESN